jgi:hypothetical protein
VRDGVGLVEAAGDAGLGLDGENERVDVTPTEGTAPTGGDVDCPQAARASRPSNADRDTLRYRIYRP